MTRRRSLRCWNRDLADDFDGFDDRKGPSGHLGTPSFRRSHGSTLPSGTFECGGVDRARPFVGISLRPPFESNWCVESALLLATPLLLSRNVRDATDQAAADEKHHDECHNQSDPPVVLLVGRIGVQRLANRRRRRRLVARNRRWTRRGWWYRQRRRGGRRRQRRRCRNRGRIRRWWWR